MGSTHSEVIYEVNLDVDQEVASAFREWLAEHVRMMLQQKGFVDARIWQPQSSASEPDRQHYVVHYRVASLADLEHYLATAAQAMRQQGLDRFCEQFRANRRILLALQST